ncbi:MAG: hypothetical protein HY425_03040 [Candidatus Levybacteria bacterium]|nr:hypothetical protein [Candidatus Levybacteria bacterium]
MVIAERQLGLFGLIKEQQKANKGYGFLTNDQWALYGDKRRVEKYSSWNPLLDGYQENFDKVLNGVSLIDLVLRRKRPIAIDIMGPSDTLADLAVTAKNKDKHKKILGIAISYKDIRDKEKKSRDKALNIWQIEGDVMDNKTWKEVKSKLGGRKVDLIMERMGAGYSGIPRNPIFYGAMLVKIWKLLSNEDGTFVGQVPPGFSIVINQAVDYLRNNNVDILLEEDVVKIVKTKSSPEDIGPILRTLKKPKQEGDALDYMLADFPFKI